MGFVLAAALAGCGDGAAGEGDGANPPTPERLPQPPETTYLHDTLPPMVPDEPSPKPPEKPDPAPAEQCDPNYTPCVPIDSDVDCAGGKGNGPSYVRGPVRVIGRDVYGLDHDHDGVGCDR